MFSIKFNVKKRAFLLCSSAVLFISSCNQTPGNNASSSGVDSTTNEHNYADSPALSALPVPNTIMTKEYVAAIGRYAYLWGWPMVNIHNRKVTFERLPGPGYMGGIVPVAPANQIGMLTDYIAPQERVVACPNQDVVYGFAILDFSKEAVVIQVPDFGDRFWVYQICNQRSDGFAEVGKMYDSKPGFYLLTGANWKGKVPDGIIKTFRCPTTYGVIIPRAFQSDDPADKKAIQPALQQIQIYPLSQFDGKMKSKDWSTMPKYPADKSSGEEETKWVRPENFFDVMPDILKEVPPMPGEEGWYAQMQSVLDAAAKNPKVKEWLQQSALNADKELIPPLFQFTNVGYPVKYNWTTQSNGAQFGFDYLTRTSCAKANIFVNKPVETKYFYQDLDSSGVRLHGKNKYTVTYAKGEIPPVKGFWSLTLYNKHHFFSPNSLGRYSLGTKNKNLKYNPDGSLTLYVQSTPPDESKMNNWLPAPVEDFSLYQRCYWPEERILNDGWNPPPVVKIK
jgi:hypothetical protein